MVESLNTGGEQQRWSERVIGEDVEIVIDDRRTEQAAFSILSDTGTGLWEYDLVADRVWWSRNMGPLFGRPPGYQPLTMQGFLAMIDPEDRPVLQALIRQSFAGWEQGEIEYRAVWPDGTLRWMRVRGHVFRDRHGDPVRAVGTATDVTETRRRRDQERFLLEASDLLGSSLDYRRTLRTLAELVVPKLADWCGLLVEEPDGSQLLEVVHADPDKRELALRALERYPVTRHRRAGLGRVLATGEPQLLSRIDEGVLAGLAEDEAHLELLRGLGLASAMVVPVKVADRVLGTLALVAAESRVHYGEQDLRFAEELARRAAVAIDNARLHTGSEQARRQAEKVAERLGLLQETTARLSEAVTVEAVAEIILRQGLATLGASRGTFLVADDDAGLRLVAAAGYPPERVASWSPSLNVGPTPVGEAFRTGRVVVVPDRETFAARFPEVEEMARTAMGEAWAAVPVWSTRGVAGAMGLAFDQPPDFDSDDLLLMEAVARQCGVALERALLVSDQQRILLTLQRGLIPDVEACPDGLGCAVRYLAGGPGEVGGDWYDTLTTADGSAVGLVGDVVGYGLRAVAAMAQLRNALRAYLLEGRRPGEALAALDRLVEVSLPERDRFATVAIVEHQPTTGRLVVASAGHPPPILRRGETAEFLAGWGQGLPLGAGGSQQYPESEAEASPGDTVVLYTDGLVERRGGDLAEQLEQLRAAVESGPADPEELADLLVERFRPRQPFDDATLLILQLR